MSVRIAALKQPTWQHLLGWDEQFSSGNQELTALADTDENYGDFAYSLMSASTFQPGILLNVDELASLVHLPSSTISSEWLRRIRTRTRLRAALRKGLAAVATSPWYLRGAEGGSRTHTPVRALDFESYHSPTLPYRPLRETSDLQGFRVFSFRAKSSTFALPLSVY